MCRDPVPHKPTPPTPRLTHHPATRRPPTHRCPNITRVSLRPWRAICTLRGSEGQLGGIMEGSWGPRGIQGGAWKDRRVICSPTLLRAMVWGR